MNSLPMHKRDAARLAALQVLYEHCMDDKPVTIITDRYLRAQGADMGNGGTFLMDSHYFEHLLHAHEKNKVHIPAMINAVIEPKRRVERLEILMASVLKLASAEFLCQEDVSIATIINSWLGIADMYFGGGEKQFINGVLDRLGNSLRHSITDE
ncbi:MAG: transcription antitermination factor NusB [Pseudomonadota bacterium]